MFIELYPSKYFKEFEKPMLINSSIVESIIKDDWRTESNDKDPIYIIKFRLNTGVELTECYTFELTNATKTKMHPLKIRDKRFRELSALIV